MTTSSPALERGAPRTLVDALLPARSDDVQRLARAVLLVAGGAALVALAAQLSFRFPWSPVPYTGQTAAVLLAGTVLGWRMGAASMLLYVSVGVAGAPVFSNGASGTAQLLGITGGYLGGFVLAAVLVGRLAEQGWDRSPLTAAGLMALGNLVIYAVGVPVLAFSLSMDPASAAWNGAAVFLPWDAFKILVAAGLLPLAWRLVQGRR